jgi:hypothetical protein
MGEAKRRASWIAKGGEDWGLKRFRSPTRWAARIRGLDEKGIRALELARSQRRVHHMLALCGMVVALHTTSKHRNPQARPVLRPQARGR